MTNKNRFYKTDKEKQPDPLTGEAQKRFIVDVYRIFIFSLLSSALASYIGIILKIPFSWGWVALEIIAFLICIFSPRSLPTLFLWTIMSGLSSAPILRGIIEEGHLNLIWQALLTTVLLFTILSIYVFYTKKDFSHWRGVLFALLVLLILSSLAFIVFPTHHGEIVFTFFAVLVFSAYVLFDTSNILYNYRPGDEIMAALDLHLDFVNLFWDLLSSALSSDHDHDFTDH